MEARYKSVVNVIARLQGNSALQSRFYVAGGMVPWLLAGRDSKRLHGDLDLVVERQDMSVFRGEMQRIGCYDADTDAQCIWPDSCVDYGFDCILDNVSINIAPFQIVNDGIVQRNATYARLDHRCTAFSVRIPMLSRTAYVTHSPWHNGTLLGHYPTALVYATKRITNRPKDQYDCRELERNGINQVEVLRYQEVLQHMHITQDIS